MGPTSDPYLEDDEPTYPAKPKAESGMRQKVVLERNETRETTAVTVVVEVDPEPDTEPDTPTFPR